MASETWILDAEEVPVGACGVGNSQCRRVDGRSEMKQVSFRTALDRHDASNAPLRVLPGS